MNYPGFEFSRQRIGYKVTQDLDDYAIAAKTSENKHVFFFKCPKCGSNNGTNLCPPTSWTAR